MGALWMLPHIPVRKANESIPCSLGETRFVAEMSTTPAQRTPAELDRDITGPVSPESIALFLVHALPTLCETLHHKTDHGRCHSKQCLDSQLLMCVRRTHCVHRGSCFWAAGICSWACVGAPSKSTRRPFVRWHAAAQSAGPGGVFARRATFVLPIPSLTPDLPSPRRAPQVDQEWAANLPYKAHCISRNS